MRSLRFDRFGPPEVMVVADVPAPQAGPGQIRIAVYAAGVNPVDWKIRHHGSVPVTLPHITGLDAAGVVDQVGEGVTGVGIGDEVFGSTVTGAAAEYALLEHFARKPEHMSWAEAAGLPSAVETAARALEPLKIKDGDLLLINGVAGGVGLAAAQLAQARGAVVIGTASPGNHEFLRALRVMPTTYGTGLADRVRDLAPDGVRAALDAAGGGALPDLIALAGSADRVITVADPQAAAHGVIFTTGSEGRAWHALAEAAGLFRQGRFTLPVARMFPLEQGAAAHRLSEQGHVRGKLVLILR